MFKNHTETFVDNDDEDDDDDDDDDDDSPHRLSFVQFFHTLNLGNKPLTLQILSLCK